MCSVISARDALYAGMERADADVRAGPTSDKVWTYNRSNVVMPDDGAPSATASAP